VKHPYITIDGIKVGPEHPPYIVAEISCNHGGDLQVLLDTISEAKEVGCDAVKIQTYEAEDLTIRSTLSDFSIDSKKWGYDTLFDLYEASQTPYEWHFDIFACAKSCGITLFSTPFSLRGVELLKTLDAPAYKIASMELNYPDLLEAVGKTRKPVILSTGLASMEDIHEAVNLVTDAAYGTQYHNGYTPEIAILHCISDYPTTYDKANTRRIRNIRRALDNPNIVYGLSDHTVDSSIPAITAIAQGASILEKHFMLPGTDSPDKHFSLLPDEMRSFINDCHTAWLSLGNGDINQTKSPSKAFERSIYAVKDIPEGQNLTPDNIAIIRPGFGMAPSNIDTLLKKGAFATKNISRGEPITYGNVII